MQIETATQKSFNEEVENFFNMVQLAYKSNENYEKRKAEKELRGFVAQSFEKSLEMLTTIATSSDSSKNHLSIEICIDELLKKVVENATKEYSIKVVFVTLKTLPKEAISTTTERMIVQTGLVYQAITSEHTPIKTKKSLSQILNAFLDLNSGI